MQSNGKRHGKRKLLHWNIITLSGVTPVKLEPGMRVFKSKLLFKTKPCGKKKVRAVVQAFKRMFSHGIDFEEKYAGTTRWNTVTIVLVLAIHYGLEVFLIDIKTFFLHGKLSKIERIFMEAIEGQKLPPGYVNKVVGSLYGHPAAAYRAKRELHDCLVHDGLFKQTASDPCLYVLQHKTEKFWLPVHVDDMPCAGTKGGLELTLKRLRESFQITVEQAPERILGVEVERDWKKKTMTLRQSAFTRELLNDYGMADCNPRTTPLEATVKPGA